jgi:autotransporter-associated beta strand protein
MNALTGLTAAYTHTKLQVEVSNAQGPGTGFQTVALCIGQSNPAGSDGLFCQVSTSDASGMFNRVELDTGVNMSDSTKWTTPTSVFTPTAFASARITASLLDADTVRLGIDTNLDGTDEQFFTRDLNLANMGFGNQIGMTITGSAMRADNFTATVTNPANVTWNVAGSGTWDMTSNNWINGSLDPNKYLNSDNAIFSNAAGGTITLAGGANALAIAPGSTTVSAASGTYTFAGSGIVSGTLTKTGAGRLVLTNSNTFTGITTVGNAGGIGATGSAAHLTLNSASGNALSGDLHIGVSSATGNNIAKVSLAHANQIADNRVIYFDSSAGNWAYLSLRGNSETVAGVVTTNTGGVIENGNLNGSINTDATLTLAPLANTTYTYGGILRDADSGGGTGKLNITVNGTGTQILSSGAYSYTGTTTVNGGTLRLETSLTTSATVNITGGALELASGGNRVIKTTSLSISGSGKLDLTDNDLVVDYATLDPTPIATIANQIMIGYANGSWNGNGIASSSAAAQSAATHRTALGVAEASSIYSSFPQTFSGQTIDSTAVLVRYTYSGDSNVDGTVDLTDFTYLAANFNGSGKTWVEGDYNYDGNVDLTDFTLLASNFNQTLPATSVAMGSTVPEPASVLPAMIIFGAMRRRRVNAGAKASVTGKSIVDSGTAAPIPLDVSALSAGIV